MWRSTVTLLRQALAYKIGQLRIVEIRSRGESIGRGKVRHPSPFHDNLLADELALELLG